MKKRKREKSYDEPDRFSIGLSQETKNGIWGILCLGIALVATLAYLGMAGSGGQLFYAFSIRLFGCGIFLVPVALGMLGIAFLKDIHRKIYSSALIGTALFVFSFLAIFYILGDGDFNVRLLQGGYLGVLIGYPLLAAIGFTAALVVLMLLILVAFLVTLNISVAKLIPWKRQSEEEQIAQEANRELKDNVVIKQGNRVVDPSYAPFEKAGASEGKVVKPQTPTDEFVIKTSKSGAWKLPPIDLLHSDKDTPRAGDINANVAIIKRTLAHFGIEVEMGEVSIGPTVTQFTLRPAVGVKLSRITALQSDLALALAAHPIRIEAPIPGKALVGIEVPNKKSAIVGLRDLLEL